MIRKILCLTMIVVLALSSVGYTSANNLRQAKFALHHVSGITFVDRESAVRGDMSKTIPSALTIHSLAVLKDELVLKGEVTVKDEILPFSLSGRLVRVTTAAGETVLSYMNDKCGNFEDIYFSASSDQLYSWVLNRDIFEEVREEGKFLQLYLVNRYTQQLSRWALTN